MVNLTTLAMAQSADILRSVVAGDQGAIEVIRIDGSGLPVLFLHADPGSANQWIDVMTAVSPRHPVAAYDARGSGESAPAANRDYSFAARAVDLGLVADAVGFDRFVIVAHSGGVAVAMTYCAAHPELVAGLFLIDPPRDPRALSAEDWTATVERLRGPDGETIFLGFVASIAGSDDAVRAQVLADARRIAPGARSGTTEAVSHWNPEQAILGIEAPVYLLTTPENSGLAELWNLTKNDHAVSRTTGHWIQLDDPALVIEELDRFLGRIDDGS